MRTVNKNIGNRICIDLGFLRKKRKVEDIDLTQLSLIVHELNYAYDKLVRDGNSDESLRIINGVDNALLTILKRYPKVEAFSYLKEYSTKLREMYEQQPSNMIYRAIENLKNAVSYTLENIDGELKLNEIHKLLLLYER